MGGSTESSVDAMRMVKRQNLPKITFQETMEKEDVDRISALPDCLIIEILSRLLSTKEAIRTGTLSKRWKHLWTWVPSLYFKVNICIWSDFVSSIDKTLTQCRQRTLKKFVVSTIYDTSAESHINNWIHYAISRNGEELNLRLWVYIVGAEFPLDQIFFVNPFFTDLTLSGCIVKPNGAISWNNLKSLSIDMGNLGEHLIKNILSGSPILQTLVLDYCYGFRRIDIASKSVKNLVFSGYNDANDESDFLSEDVIEINAPNILSLTIQGELSLWKLLLLNVSSLVKANLDYEKNGHYETTLSKAEEEMLEGFILNLRHVKELEIGFS